MKVLHFFTTTFPYDKGESFIDNEIIFLSNSFDKVFIYPQYDSSPLKRKVPENITIIHSIPQTHKGRKLATLFANLWLFMRLLYIEYSSTNTIKAFIKHLHCTFTNIGILSYSVKQADLIEKNIVKGADNFFYSYWMNESAVSLSILAYKKTINGFISRAHGYDLYDERGINQYIPFRNLVSITATNILPISAFGVKYLKQRVNYPEKIKLSRLGVNDHGTNPLNHGHFSIVSCSYVYDLKRVDKIPEILKHIDFPVTWTHIGDGVLFDDLITKAKSLPSNIKVNLLGYLSNTQIIEYYKTHPINVFLHLSESEGIPVSMMEAISFGIPIIATEVGGVPEIVTENTGILIEPNFVPKEVANTLIEFKSSSKNTAPFRNQVKQFWQNDFNASINYSDFIKKFLH